MRFRRKKKKAKRKKKKKNCDETRRRNRNTVAFLTIRMLKKVGNVAELNGTKRCIDRSKLYASFILCTLARSKSDNGLLNNFIYLQIILVKIHSQQLSISLCRRNPSRCLKINESVKRSQRDTVSYTFLQILYLAIEEKDE